MSGSVAFEVAANHERAPIWLERTIALVTPRIAIPTRKGDANIFVAWNPQGKRAGEVRTTTVAPSKYQTQAANDRDLIPDGQGRDLPNRPRFIGVALHARRNDGNSNVL